MFQASELSKKLPNWHFAPTCHGLIHVPGPECIVLFKVGFCAPLQDVCVCAWMDCPTDCPASVLPATYCPAKVLQAWPSHDWVLLLVGLRVLLDQITNKSTSHGKCAPPGACLHCSVPRPTLVIVGTSGLTSRTNLRSSSNGRDQDNCRDQ